MTFGAKLKKHVPAIIAFAYALVSSAWIFSSDRILVWIAGDYADYQLLQTAKGWAFVIVSAPLLYLALRYAWRRSEQAYEILNLASDVARLGGWRAELKTGKVDATAGSYAAFALPDGPFEIEIVLGCFSEQDRNSVKEAFQRALVERSESSGEYFIHALDGTQKWVRVIQRPIVGRDNNVGSVLGAVQDVSETVAYREEAAIQSRRIHNMFENMPDAFLLLNQDLIISFANTAALTKFSHDDNAVTSWIGKSFWDFFQFAEQQIRIPLDHLQRKGLPFTLVLENTVSDILLKVVAYATPDGIAMHLRDVTEDVRRENALRASEERFRLTCLASQDVLFDWDIALDHLTLSEAAQLQHGYDSASFAKTRPDWLSRIHLDDRERVQMSLNQFFAQTGQDLWTITYRFMRADGSVAHILERGVATRHSDGRPVRMVGTISDVSDLHEEQQRLRAIIDVASDAIFEYDPKRGTVFFSEGIRAKFGYELVGEKAVPTPWQDTLHPDDREALLTDFTNFCEGRQTVWRREYRMVMADGRYATVLERAVAVRGDDGALLRVIGSIEDVTLDRLQEAQIKQSDRIEAVGKLTGGVAHDFNNLLTIIIGNAEIIEESADVDPISRERAAVILRAAERGAELTAALLAFSGKQPLVPKVLDVGKGLEEVRLLLNRTLSANIELQIVLDSDLWFVEADPAQLNAAILNLALNARDAMPNGGRLTIKCENARIDEAYVAKFPSARLGDFVQIAVTDSGAGMSQDLQRRVFEPFFTTKGLGEGTGMGLSMVHGFVTQSGGHITLRSEVGQGSTFTLFLPRSLVDHLQESGATPATSEPSGREHVLIVEDNPLLLPHVTNIVAGLGYRVSSAIDATAALEILRNSSDVDVLLTDIMLPGNTNGAALARLAKEMLPHLKVLFTSGYSEDVIIHDGRLDSGVRLLAKPYRRHEIARRLREVIDEIE